MAGNSSRRGAIRKTGTKKGSVVGSGGQRRKGLEGRGPTPKATERTKHPAAKRARAAAKAAERQRPTSAARRRATGAGEVLGGRNAVVEALRAGVPARTLHVAQRVEVDDRVREALQLAADRNLAIMEVPRAELDKITGGLGHQGLALSVPPYNYSDIDDIFELARNRGEEPFIVLLDSVTDPRNLGAIVRSVSAFGGHGVIIPERRAASMTAAAWKTSAGAAARVPVASVTNLTRTIKELQDRGCHVVGLAGEAQTTVQNLSVQDGPMAIVVGSEGKGLSRLVGESCNELASIQIADAMESLNASVAAGIALYELSRNR